MEKRKFLFYYLNTGAGHISAARVLTKSIQTVNPETEVKMLNGFRSHMLGHIIFEKGYNYSTNYAKGSFPIVYDIGQHRFAQSVLKHLLAPETKRHLRKQILKEHPTDIVSFHFAINPFLKEVIKNIPWKINLTCIVTDPFTVPTTWFYEKDLKYMVYSQEAKDTAVKVCGIPENNVQIIPFLMNEKFCVSMSDEQKKETRIRLGFDPDKKIVLLVGGGEGLPGATEIINNCIFHKAKFTVAVICGRDKVKQKSLTLLKLANPKLDLHVFGFVDNMDELVKISDCAVIKAGPATLMEILSCRKPVIICKYIHNQELGNMHYAVRNRVGWFIRSPGKIFKKINQLLEATDFDEKMKERFSSLVIDTDASKVAELLLRK